MKLRAGGKYRETSELVSVFMCPMSTLCYYCPKTNSTVLCKSEQSYLAMSLFFQEILCHSTELKSDQLDVYHLQNLVLVRWMEKGEGWRPW